MRVSGSLRVPGDKSISHRALVLSALADGESRVRGLLTGADVRSTAGALRALGARVPDLAPAMRLPGGLAADARDVAALDCGNSGTTARLLAGVAAALRGRVARFTGDASLSRRPMRRVAAPLARMGATVELSPGDVLPMTVRGAALAPLEWRSETASAQVKSAILLAGLVAGVPVSVTEPARSRDHTERMLAAVGAEVRVHGASVTLAATHGIRPLDLTVPADPSSAAFFAGLAALADAGELALDGVCINETRTGFYGALERMGARLTIEREGMACGEPVGTIRVAAGALRGTTVGGDEVPTLIDEIPLLACLAARAEGETTITGAAELRVKESDRIGAAVHNLRAIGADAEELPDGLRVVGSRRPLRGAVRTHGDHRLAMAFGVLGALPGNAVTVDDPACVVVSYPHFWRDLGRLTT
jgi:3-phosphoshikimate 1-carboxyvinyltransferase